MKQRHRKSEPYVSLLTPASLASLMLVHVVSPKLPDL